jgi:hypothetical protein
MSGEALRSEGRWAGGCHGRWSMVAICRDLSICRSRDVVVRIVDSRIEMIDDR